MLCNVINPNFAVGNWLCRQFFQLTISPWKKGLGVWRSQISLLSVFFYSILGWAIRCGHIQPPPPSSYIQKPKLQIMIKPTSSIYLNPLFIEGLKPNETHQPPKIPTFWKYWKSNWKLVIFKRDGFLGSQRGGFVFLTLKNYFLYQLFFFYLRFKKAIFSKKSVSENMYCKTFLGPQPSTITRIKNSLTLGIGGRASWAGGAAALLQ